MSYEFEYGSSLPFLRLYAESARNDISTGGA
jgi:hypothetical protein